jgi:hypothetical protein
MRPALRWIVAALALLLAGVVVDTARAAPRDGLRHAIAPFLVRPLPGTAIQAAVMVQRADCTGNLRLLDLLHRDAVRSRLRLAVIWYVGPSSDTLAIRRLLPAWTARTPLVAAPSEALGELRRLGHSETPTLVVLDQDGRVRLTTRSPRSVREFAGLQRVVEGLTWIEEL